MPNVITEKVNTEIKYKKSMQDDIVSQVVKNWDNWDDDRQAQIDIIDKLEDLLDVQNKTKERVEDSFGEKQEIEKLKDADILQLYNAAVAHTYGNTFKNVAQNLSVELENQLNDSQMAEMAYLQKASLLDVWKKARGKQKGRKAIENWYKKGEIILYVNWKQIKQRIRRKVGFNFMGVDLREWQVQETLKYDGADIKCIEPEDFVFDTARIDDFENAPKIHRTWVTVQDIRENEQYAKYLSKQDLKELEDMAKCSDDKDLSNQDEEQDTKAHKNGMIKVLEYIGDIKIKDEFYRNMKIIVIGRKFCGCYEYNPNIISPFVFAAARIHKDTGRGVPNLSFIIPLTEETAELLNKINKAIGLSVNKCYLAPKGAFTEKPVVSENGIIEYSDGGFAPNAITPLDFTSGLPYAMQYLQYLSGKKEQAFGVYKNATGESVQGKQTATEAKIAAAGQNALISYEQDIIDNDVIVPTFEKIGEMQANFQDQQQQVKYKDQFGQESVGIVDDTVRQGNYSYIIGDGSTSMQKQMNAEQMLIAIERITPLAMQQGYMPNITELLNAVGAVYDYENAIKFFQRIEPEQGGLLDEAGAAAGMPEALPIDPTAGLQGIEAEIPTGDIQPDIY